MVEVAGTTLLGGLRTAGFLRRYWQKKPLLVRQAIPNFRGVLSRGELFSLAGRDDVESRLVRRVRGRWTLARGPFDASQLRRLPPRDWTLLVQGVNLHVDAADALLRRFAFIPYARLDDVMVSYAAPGGGVGPHVDSYDVFLLQGDGRRRWRLGSQPVGPRDLHLDAAAPIKILKRFQPDADCTLDPGDMLYLPPNRAHDGVAVDECTTYSIGFRAPSAQELGTAFLDWLRDSIRLEGRYGDAALVAAADPARIGEAIHRRCRKMLKGIRWSDAAMGHFLGLYLSEPKPNVYFEPPARPLAHAAFRSSALRRGLVLDRRTQLLYDKHHGFINGTSFDWTGRNTDLIKQLANRRKIPGSKLSDPNPGLAATTSLFYQWYCDGFLHIG